MSCRQSRRGGPQPRRREVRLDDLKAIIERAKTGPLTSEDLATLSAAVDTLAFLTQELEAKGTTLDRLRRMLFGARTEKTRNVVGSANGTGGAAAGRPDDTTSGAGAPAGDPKPKAPGHGRNGAGAYVGATVVKVTHESLTRGDMCPECQKGKVYPLEEPAMLLRITAMAPLQAFRYELDRLRCNACQEVFTAETPEGVGPDKYDETAAAMIGLLRYGTGLPFNRIGRLEKGFGIPLPPTTQWEVVERAAKLMAPAFEELCRQAAQGKLLHNDDTTMKVLELMAKSRREADEADDETDNDEEPGKERTGIFTSGIVGETDGHQIALFFTGRQHAGENLADVLARRAAELPPPIQMCDGLAASTAGDFKTIVANCIAHGRRQFVDVANDFPAECEHVLEELKKVYENDAITRKQKMSDDERLRFHQEHSRKTMDDLKEWMERQFSERRVEENSGLGEAIAYMVKHWSELTLFLREPGAPLDNNICERALKKAICHRKNSLFYKTQNGAHVGDMFMSFIHTAELNDVNPFDYLVALQRHHEEVAANPAEWMPWNYKEPLERGKAGPGPPA
ncbi:MAG: IS66 family transposase [Verrucomicrobia bacterium]|nr:IS66 family transposase [Verrucomicrobiota bacterium]